MKLRNKCVSLQTCALVRVEAFRHVLGSFVALWSNLLSRFMYDYYEVVKPY